MNRLLLALLIATLIAVEVHAEHEGRICKPGDIGTTECGICRCNEEGTEFDCNDCPRDGQHPAGLSESGRGKRKARAAGGRCIPGTTFQVDCNMCVCPDSGIAANAACTLIACPPIGSHQPYPQNYRRRFNRW